MENKLIKWTEDLNTGLIWQDFQHRALFGKIHELYLALIDHEGKEKLIEVINFLESYTKDHFGIEEKYMETYKYSHISEHKNQHLKFKTNVEEFKTYAIKNELTAISICYDLNQWFVQHIEQTDKQLSHFLKTSSVRDMI